MSFPTASANFPEKTIASFNTFLLASASLYFKIVMKSAKPFNNILL